MSIELKVPSLPESVADATIATWHKKVGDVVSRDENLVDLETDKVVLEVPSPVDGILTEILFEQGKTVTSGQVLGRLTEGKSETSSSPSEAASTVTQEDISTGPAVRRMLAEHGIEPSQMVGTGKEGRLTKEDVMAYVASQRASQASAKIASPSNAQPAVSVSSPASSPVSSPVSTPVLAQNIAQGAAFGREVRRVPMTRLRAKIAERLVQAQHEAAMLTTFNEVNLQAVMDIRSQYKDAFEKRHGVKLGFMSFFTKAVVESLKRFPAVNASIDGQDILYHDYYDIGVAVSTERGLVVPVIRDADKLGLAEIERSITDSASRAREGRLSMEEMQGGTFTITNGGVFGSLLSTPIINPPQSGILGMHKIEERAVVEKGQIVIRPMMYIALSYDHRLIDGKDSVQFLVSIKSFLEDPARFLLDV